jgi:hypothetical protein
VLSGPDAVRLIAEIGRELDRVRDELTERQETS